MDAVRSRCNSDVLQLDDDEPLVKHYGQKGFGLTGVAAVAPGTKQCALPAKKHCHRHGGLSRCGDNVHDKLRCDRSFLLAQKGCAPI